MIISFILVLFNINNVNAKEIITATVNEEQGLYIRKGAGTSYDYVKLLKDGETITLVADTKVKGAGCDGWYEVIYNGKQVTWDDIAGLAYAKKCIMEAIIWPMQRPDLFTGLRTVPRGMIVCL